MHPDDPFPELGEQWRTDVVLKRDVFSTIERGFYKTYGQSEFVERPAILRRIDQVPLWSRFLARHFLKREARALAAAGEFGIAPKLLYSGKRVLVRSWIDGLPLHIARPEGDCGFFRSAKRALFLLHRAGFTHNDLAKEQNWLRTRDGDAALTDFQLATFFRRKTRLYRIAAYEDIRHLLKHKRRYAPDALTASERRILARKSWITRIWMATGKRVYYWITRGLLNFTDREGGGRRLVNDAPRIAALLKKHPLVRDVAIVAYPDRKTGTGLYAFVESQGFSEAVLSAYLARGLKDVFPPERVQLVDALPRDKAGLVRTEILQLVALNQVDLIDPLVGDDISRRIVSKIVAGRQNLRDRFAY